MDHHQNFQHPSIKEEEIDDVFHFMRRSPEEIQELNRKFALNLLKTSNKSHENHPMTRIPTENIQKYLDEEKAQIEPQQSLKRKRKSQNSTSKKQKITKVYKCTQCDYENSLKCIINRHINLHNIPGSLQCNKCNAL